MTAEAVSTDQARGPQPGVDPLLDVRDLKVHFPIRRGVILDRTVGHVYAVDGVSLTVNRGETYGLVGESGCGKTTFGRGLLRLVEPTGGQAFFDGVELRSLKGEGLRNMRRRMQMVFQDPLSSLDPRQSIESILSEGLKAHGQYDNRESGAKKLREILSAVGLPHGALRKYPHEFSGGQRQRIGIARAIVLRPDLVVADEPVSALDVSVQAQVINLLEDLQSEFGLTYLVIAHDLAVVRHISDRVGVMYLGGLVEEASSDDLYREPLHPYTKALMSAVPVPDPTVEDSRQQILLAGDLPSPANPPSGCRFHTRCPWRQETKCDTERPVLRELQPGHRVACHWAEDIRDGRIKAHDVAVELVHPDGGPRTGPDVAQTTAEIAGTLPPGAPGGF
jgi:peptide/nickel transport system ATP-binding protein